MNYRQSGLGFWECDICAAKPGSPPLCPWCLHNRKVIEDFLHAKRSSAETRVLRAATAGFVGTVCAFVSVILFFVAAIPIGIPQTIVEPLGFVPFLFGAVFGTTRLGFWVADRVVK